MDPPQCVQNAMMTKDKKPFTYTPGGIDLSEVRSPRMARRIERNANLGGAGDNPKPQPTPPVNYGPLPPSTLAAMRPQPQVQVFPSGPVPAAPMRGGAPPPPPPPCNMPPPPPPPSAPLPTQKIRTGDNQTLERPDMTKIIPDNPMQLLRKTGGPAPRKSIVDELFSQGGNAAPGPRSPPAVVQRPLQQEPEQQRYQPAVSERGTPISPVPQQQQQQQPQARQYQPQVQQFTPPPKQQYQPTPPQQQYSPDDVKEQPRYRQPPVIERKPTMRQNNEEPELKTSTAHLGSLYIPPVNQQQQKRVVSPPTPPERSQNSPVIQTPPLKEAPKPWQGKKPQQEEQPPWTKRDNQVSSGREEIKNNYQSPPPPAQQQPKWPQTRPAQPTQANQQQYQKPEYIEPPYKPQPQYNQQQPQYNQQQPQYNQQQPIGVRIEIRTGAPYQDGPEEKKPHAVYVTQPVVLQHPGPRQQQQQVARTPSTPGSERTLTRQQSWGNNPSQSNSFKLIQKITQTDDDEEDPNTPITEHAPKFPQNFQQSGDQMRRMKISDGDQNMANRFKQVPGGPQNQGRSPQVRTIPIQIEDDEPPQKYVHPSEQVVPEPKKYTGSAIPSRSFKILQAMTAPPDNCANVDDQNEASLYDQWGYDTNHYPYPPPPPSYWHEYYHNYYYPEPNPQLSGVGELTETSSKSTPKRPATPRQTPVPFWGYAPPYPTPKPRNPSANEGDIPEDSFNNPRATPVPFWNYGYPYYPEEETQDQEEANSYPYYPPCYDPYYYHYYYGYPPMYPPYPLYGPSDAEDCADYTSTDDTYQNNKTISRNGNKTPKNAKKIVTPTLCVKEQVLKKSIPEAIMEKDTSDSGSDSTEDEEELIESQSRYNLNPLQSIKSVNNINVFRDDDNASEPDIIVDEYSDGTNDDTDEETSVYLEEDDGYPHQLSVIMEESERTDSRLRSVSVMSDSSTIAEKSDVEDDEPQLATIKLPSKSCERNHASEFTRNSPPPMLKRSTSMEKPNNISDRIIESTKEVSEEDGKESDESEDWWGILGEEDDLPKPKKSIFEAENQVEESVTTEDVPTVIQTSETESCQESELDLKKNYNRRSVYDADEEDDIESGGKLIEMESFEVKESVITEDASAMTQASETKSCQESKMNLKKDYNRINVYDADEEDDIESGGKLTKMESFIVEKSVVTEVAPAVTQASETKSCQESKLDLKKKYNRRSVYDADEEDDIESGGKLIEMESFVAQFEELQKNSCLWNFNLQKKGSNSSDTKKHNIDCSNETRTEASNSDTSKSSANYTSYNSSKSSLERNDKNAQREIYTKSDSDESSDDESSSSEDDEEENGPKLSEGTAAEPTEVKILSVQERIKALKESIKQKQSKLIGQEIKSSVRERVSAIETTNQSRSKTTSTKSSLKSFEEYSEEEEVDSGVTSDMSRHISDSEEFPELKKLTRYQRAATHSRLFKLLQEECDNEVDEEDDQSNMLTVRQNNGTENESPRRDLLSLPLNKFSESDSITSSGRNSPSSTVNEKLVNELVQSLLKRKKGQAFRNMPKEKLYAAAVKILQEDLEGSETPSDYGSMLSPLRSSTGYSTAAQTPQEFNNNYDDYKQYYESWNEAEKLNHENDILQSKTLKLLQDHSDLSRTGVISGLLAKCPKVISSKNIHKKIMKLLESSDSFSPTSDKPLDSNEVTTAS